MTVYIVRSVTDYEDSTTHGVYSSFELASENAKIVQDWIDTGRWYDQRVVIAELRLDAAPTLPEY
jgi:hypothetical protein